MAEKFDDQRELMVETQIRRRSIRDPLVLKSLLTVQREYFIPEGDKTQSYYDGPLSIGFGQTISQPYIVAYMTEMLELKGEERVLELGTGSGYQTAILAEIVDHVFTVEVVDELADRAQELLTGRLGYTNISFKVGNGRDGWPEHGPFDRILITAAPQAFPECLFPQLTDGGIAVAPVGNYFQKIYQYRKKGEKIIEKPLIAVTFVPLI